MARNQNYSELLKHPKWQKKRLMVMKLQDFSCEICGTEDKTLNVHHMYYDKNLKPWEYPDQSLHCLCENCHKEIQEIQNQIKKQIGKIEISDIEKVLGYLKGLESTWYPMVEFCIDSHEEAEGIGASWNLEAEHVILALKEKHINGYTLHKIKGQVCGKSSS